MSSLSETVENRSEPRLVLRSHRCCADGPEPLDVMDSSAETVYSARQEDPVPVRVYRLVDGELCTTDCRLLEISQNGARLEAPGELPVGDGVGLRIIVEDANLDHTVASVVCWAKCDESNEAGPRTKCELSLGSNNPLPMVARNLTQTEQLSACKDTKRWLVGCSFASEVSEAVLIELAQAGLLERRHSERQDIKLTATARCPRRLSEAVEVHVENFSAGGFCMYSPEALEAGDFLEIEVQPAEGDPQVVQAEVLWKDICVIGFMLGCRYVDADSAERMREVAQSQNELSRVHRPSPGEGRSLAPYWVWIGLAVAAGWVWFTFF